VKITLDGENVFHVKRGEVLEDKLPLTPITQAQSATSAQAIEANVENKPNITEQGIRVEPQAEIEPQLESTATISQLEQTQHEPITLEPEAFDVQFEVLPALKSEVKRNFHSQILHLNHGIMFVTRLLKDSLNLAGLKVLLSIYWFINLNSSMSCSKRWTACRS
jgi:hypothetical protein